MVDDLITAGCVVAHECGAWTAPEPAADSGRAGASVATCALCAAASSSRLLVPSPQALAEALRLRERVSHSRGSRRQRSVGSTGSTTSQLAPAPALVRAVPTEADVVMTGMDEAEL